MKSIISKGFFIHKIPIGPRPRGVFFNYIIFSLKLPKISSTRPVDSRRYQLFMILPLNANLDAALKVRSLPSKITQLGDQNGNQHRNQILDPNDKYEDGY